MLEGILYFWIIIIVEDKYFSGFVDKQLLVSPCLQISDQFRQQWFPNEGIPGFRIHMDGRFCRGFWAICFGMIRILLSRKGREIRNGHHEKLQMPVPVQGNIRKIIISRMESPDADDVTV